MPIKPSTTPAHELLISIRKMLIGAHSRLNHTGVMAAGEDADLFLHDPKHDTYFRVLVTPITEAEYTASIHPTSFRRMSPPCAVTPPLPAFLGTTPQAEAMERWVTAPIKSLQDETSAQGIMTYTNHQDVLVAEAARHSLERLSRAVRRAFQGLQLRVEALEAQGKKDRSDIELLESYVGQYTPGGPTAEELESMDNYVADTAEQASRHSPWDALEPHPYTIGTCPELQHAGVHVPLNVDPEHCKYCGVYLLKETEPNE